MPDRNEEIMTQETQLPFKTPEGEAQHLAAYEAALARWPAPPEDLYVSTRLGDTHILASGPREAPPLILLHCLLGSATAWGPNIAGLSQHYRTYAVDVIGEPNKSRPTRSAHEERDFAAWMVDIFDALQIQRAHLVGNSFGGFLTLNTAAYARIGWAASCYSVPPPHSHRSGRSTRNFFFHH